VTFLFAIHPPEWQTSKTDWNNLLFLSRFWQSPERTLKPSARAHFTEHSESKV